MFASIQQMARDAGRNPSALSMIVRANLEITKDPLPAGRFVFSGTEEQIKEDIAACRRIGAHELFFDPTFVANSLDEWLSLMDRVRKLSDDALAVAG